MRGFVICQWELAQIVGLSSYECCLYQQLGPQYVCHSHFSVNRYFDLVAFFVANFCNDLFISDYFSIMGPPFFRIVGC